jgi:hypothetical protein
MARGICVAAEDRGEYGFRLSVPLLADLAR